MLSMESEAKKKWYQTTGGIIALLILFFPAGLYLMWKHAKWNKAVKGVITGFFVLLLIGSFNSDTSKTASFTSEPTQAPQATTAPTNMPEPTNDSVKANTPVPTQAKQVQKPTTAPVSSVSVSQKNAISKAKSYLNYT